MRYPKGSVAEQPMALVQVDAAQAIASGDEEGFVSRDVTAFVEAVCRQRAKLGLDRGTYIVQIAFVPEEA